MKKNMVEKIKESLSAVLPITVIVFILSVTIAPLTGEMLFMFMVGAAMLIIGLGLFTMGVDTSMVLMGERIGTTITRSKKVWVIVLSCFAIGVLVTIAEPSLRVLADQAPIVETMTLIMSVAVGVGVLLAIAFLRIILQIKLSYILIFLYALVFVLALSPLIPDDFISIAFDSGGVATGPMTVPFIMALGAGLAAVRGDKTTQADTFGLVALSAVGAILTVIILGIFAEDTSVVANMMTIPQFDNVKETFAEFLIAIPAYMLEVAQAVLPIIVLCVGYQLFKIKMNKKAFLKVIIGFVFNYLGLVLFLTGVNIGFMPIGQYMGESIAAGGASWILVPLGAVIGYFIVAAEPAVHTLKRQVEDATQGQISSKLLERALSIGVAISVGLSMLRVLTGLPLLWLVVPGYAFSLIMTFFVPPLFTAIAFDSGGVASGPMSATFLLPFAMGACAGVGGNMVTDAFGIIAMVAMTPVLVIQIFGLVMKLKERRAEGAELPEETEDIVDAELASSLVDDIVDI